MIDTKLLPQHASKSKAIAAWGFNRTWGFPKFAVSHDKKMLYLENYLASGELGEAAKLTGITRRTAEEWRGKDEVFAKAFNTIRNEIDNKWQIRHENDLRGIVFDEKTPAQSRILGHFFFLKSLDDRYKDRPVEHKGTVEVVHSFNFVLPDGTKVKPKELGTFKEVKEDAIQGQTKGSTIPEELGSTEETT